MLISHWLNDPEIYTYWGGMPYSVDQVKEKYLGKRSPLVECFIIEQDTGPIGFIQYWKSNGDMGVGGIDMFLIPSKRGLGLAADSVKALSLHLFNELGWQKITVDPAVSNTSAIKAWTKMGFVKEREIEDDSGEQKIIMSLTKPRKPV